MNEETKQLAKYLSKRIEEAKEEILDAIEGQEIGEFEEDLIQDDDFEELEEKEEYEGERKHIPDSGTSEDTPETPKEEKKKGEEK